MFEFNLDDFKFIEDIFKEEVAPDFKLRKSFNKVEGFSEETEAEIMVRINNSKITVARINILNTRKGIFTKILNGLINYCNINDKNKIIIESILTEEMLNFALKNGFVPDEHTINYYEGLAFGNYELNLDNKNKN